MATTSTAAHNGAHSTTRHTDVSASAYAQRAAFRTTTVGEIAALLGAQFVGDESTLITSVASLEGAPAGSISFIESEKLLSDALSSDAAAFIVPESLKELLGEALTNESSVRRGTRPIVLTGNPRLAFAKVLEFLQPTSLPEKGIHPTAIIEKSAHIGEGVTIREYCYVGHHAHIGDGAVLYPHTYIGDGAQVGDECVIYPSVVIGHHVHLGKRVKIHASTVIGGDGFGYVFDGEKHQKVPQVGNVIIGDDVEIGCNVCIDRATMGSTRVGEGTKIDNLVQIGHNVQIGKNCILCGQVGLSGSVVVEDNAILAGQVGARDHVKIGKGAIVGAQSGIIENVSPGEFVLGAPAVPQRDFMRTEAASRKMPEMLRQVRRLEKAVAELQAKIETQMVNEATE